MSRTGETGWIIALAGLPFACLLFRPLDPWSASSSWMQAWILGLWAFQLIQPSQGLLVSRPVGCWLLWTWLSAWWIWMTMARSQHVYPIGMLQGLIHATLILLAVQSFQAVMQRESLERLLRLLAIVMVFSLVYGFLQLAGLDQVFKSLDNATTKDEFVGTMGNPTHFGTQLALSLPLLWLQKDRLWKCLSGLMIVGIVLSRSTMAMASVGLWLSWWLWRDQRAWSLGLIVIGLIIGSWLFWQHSSWINPQGRWEAWQAYWTLFKDGNRMLTGLGLGWVMEHSNQELVEKGLVNGHQLWRHVHQEWLQLALEQGVIGMSLVGWIVVEWWQRWSQLLKTDLVWALGGLMLLFLFNTLANFSLHLWGLGMFALIAYSSLFVLEREPGCGR